MHTPYFVMLLELVKNKHYGFYINADARHSVASYVFEQLKGDDGEERFSEADSFSLLKFWWRYQDRQSSGELDVHIPSYLHLHVDKQKLWNLSLDSFAN